VHWAFAEGAVNKARRKEKSSVNESLPKAEALRSLHAGTLLLYLAWQGSNVWVVFTLIIVVIKIVVEYNITALHNRSCTLL
jgi:hypothetical protein